MRQWQNFLDILQKLLKALRRKGNGPRGTNSSNAKTTRLLTFELGQNQDVKDVLPARPKEDVSPDR